MKNVNFDTNIDKTKVMTSRREDSIVMSSVKMENLL